MVNDNNIIGIFYIATGIYKQFFNKFLETIHYCFPNKIKKLIIISDGLKEYDNMYINGVNIIVEDFINYAYPFINIHKFNIIEHYALKHNIHNIVYFDAETCFFEKDIKFYDDLLKQSKDKLISLIPLYFYGITMREHIISSNVYSLTAQTEGFDDFSFFYKSYDYDTCDPNYKWIQTSFFICTLDYLKKLNILMNNLITYNSRIMGCKLCFSDEFYINYLNIYYPELFHADYYAYNGDDDIRLDSMFFRQKYACPIDKQKVKFGNSNFNFRMIMFNIDSDDDINKFFIKHINNFLLYSCNSHTINDKIFYSQINLNNEWFDNEHNIILERTFYTNNFIRLYDENEKIYIGFINKINEFSDKFNYNEFYDNDYDYIEGYSFDDIKNIKFNDIDMCCFSKRYIEAYFNNDNSFKPKKYKIN